MFPRPWPESQPVFVVKTAAWQAFGVAPALAAAKSTGVAKSAACAGPSAFSRCGGSRAAAGAMGGTAMAGHPRKSSSALLQSRVGGAPTCRNLIGSETQFDPQIQLVSHNLRLVAGRKESGHCTLGY